MEVSLTTNGTFLRGRAEDLKTAGLARVNISQDALDPEQFAAVTKSGTYETVLDGVDSALEAGLAPVKLNMVVFEQTAGYVEGMVEHVADQEGLQPSSSSICPSWLVDRSGTSTSAASTTGSLRLPIVSNAVRCTTGNGTGSAVLIPTPRAMVIPEWSRSSTR